MAGIHLYDYQLDAVRRMKNGCILRGGVGSGKSLTALSYYYLRQDGEEESLLGGTYFPMGDPPKDLYIITTAKKRDTLEWEGELSPFLLSTNPDVNLYPNKVVIDSWNNISKYKDITDAFFIFDEQRVVGSGAWVKSFLKIAKKNEWILLSATPGDTWEDYIPVFVANGFYRNRTEFKEKHIIYTWVNGKYPKVDRYLNVGRLIRLRESILVDMDFKRKTISHHEDIYVKYDTEAYKDVGRLRWDPFKNEPITNASGLCYVWRRIVNSDISRQIALLELFEDHPKMIVFYNFDYELDILKTMFGRTEGVEVAEWNGHKHQPVPTGDSWVYLVQYNAGCEGWNCIQTDTIAFYSENYSYKVMQQAAGRIDRLNTPFTDLYYYHLKSRSGIDLGIARALKAKKNFNEMRFTKWSSPDKKKVA
ncbi:DEAD/DEAH box helicase family protein [Ruthenibacterium lactatiformans]|uniref:DEAD/DEAH box helicase family protein n=1 Tax=Ruthenibacterium lactatiformans TaxID=1550024 RepID=UPI001967BE51|nr:DEAD/DEAH box helicase family protein [Ruthenibacterium lactatiformans]MBN3008207.1 DEAD/DEAH box helicase family protein [Ruthenibacterium lactatiformans]